MGDLGVIRVRDCGVFFSEMHPLLPRKEVGEGAMGYLKGRRMGFLAGGEVTRRETNIGEARRSK